MRDTHNCSNNKHFDIEASKPRFKIVLLGEGAVGKSSILLRYVEDKFNAQHESTIQAAFATKEIVMESGRKVELNIWSYPLKNFKWIK